MKENRPPSRKHPFRSSARGPQTGFWQRLRGWAGNFKLFGVIGLASAAIAAISYCLLVAIAPPEPVPEPFVFAQGASWITTHETRQSTGCFRLEVSFTGRVVNAWITVAANGGFEVLSNGDACAQFFFWRRTRPFQTSLSESGQKLNPSDSAMAVNFPREYQWKDHDNAELPTWVDLTSHIHPGRNTLCVEVETNGTTPAMILSGEVQLATGEKIPLRSGAHWMAEPVPKTLPQNSWTLAATPVAGWEPARVLPWERLFWRLMPKAIFEEPFTGERIRSVIPGAITWTSQDFNLEKAPLEGFLRVVSDTPFRIWVNDTLIRPLTAHPSLTGYGPWFFRRFSRSPMDIELDGLAAPIDPSETAASLPGRQHENPSGYDRSTNDFTPDQVSPSGTINRSRTSGNLVTNGYSFKGGPNQYANPLNPDRITPPALSKNRRRAEFTAYSITPLLHRGINTVRIGLYKDEPESAELSREPFLAFDGGAQMPGGALYVFSSGKTTRCSLTTVGDNKERFVEANVDGPIEPILLPEKDVFGYAYPERPWSSVAAVVFLFCAIFLTLCTSAVPRLGQLLSRASGACAVLVGWIAAGVLLRSSMLERSEALYWRFPLAPLALLAVGLAGAALTLFLQHRRQQKRAEDALYCRLELPIWKTIWSGNWPWRVLVGASVALCFVLRAWQIDLQPPDEDEYASIQASLAIAQKGVPEYQEGVWYTRSPAYHYLAGAVGALTGSNIYTLRLLTVLFSCATAFLLWKMTRELTHSRFLALSALLLFALHPFLIFTGHVARFYQQQQFFHLLTIYFFLRGFINNSGMRDRYLTIAAFLVATLSQEISVLEIIPLFICYFLFAQRRPWPDESRILVAAGCAIALIGLDLAFFKLQCLTALDGISPRADATVGWSFEKPANFFALLVGYSRTHFIPSVFLLAGFVLAWHTKNSRWVFLYIYLFLSVTVLNLLITSRGYRFEYHLIPLWILLSVYGVGECSKLLISAREESSPRLVLAFGWLAVIVCSWSPWRILMSYDSTLQADPVRALRYVANNLRAGDKVAISELYPQAALLELGRVDYDIAVPILYDFVLRKKGKLVDRNGAAEVVGNLGALQRAFANNQRLWIVYDRDQMHARGSGVRWEYPGGRILLYLQQNAHLVFRSSLWSVYLWDQEAGEYSSFREKPGNWFD